MANNKQKQDNSEASEKEAVAKLKRVRIAPRKVRMVSDLIKDLDLEEAEAQLLMSPKRASSHILKLLKSAVANATHNHDMEANKLYIKSIRVDEGPTYKRWQPRAFGRATPINKRTSHIHITLGESEDKKSTPTYVIPEKSKDKDEDDKDKKTAQQDQTYKPEKEVEKPTETKQPGAIRRFFRRKSM